MTRITEHLSPHVIYTLMGIIVASLFLFSCNSSKQTDSGDTDSQGAALPEVTTVNHPEWSKNATIYEVNIRQFSAEGTFSAFTKDIPRLKEMGIDILWLMPIHPISKKNRKGTLGSYYSITDYTAVNPEFGSGDDLKELIDVAHSHGMKVILDWVANHTGWDSKWIAEHPRWYNRDEDGEIIAPFDWTDVADLKYDGNPELHDAMIDALKYWVTEFDIDGYRCDVAGMVPVEFWDRARVELDAVKPVFMLAEAEEAPLIVNAFDMEYGWEFHHLMNHVAKGDLDADSLQTYFERQAKRNPQGAYKMNFTSNHDENSWNGTVWERMGDGAYAFAVLTATIPGMPLVYNGQEAGMDKRLEFFEKDQIEWKEHQFFELYKALFTLKHDNKALWNGDFGGSFTRLESSNQTNIFAFVREKDDNKVVAIFNLSDQKDDYEISGDLLTGEYQQFMTDKTVDLSEKETMTLEPWEYVVFYF